MDSGFFAQCSIIEQSSGSCYDVLVPAPFNLAISSQNLQVYIRLRSRVETRKNSSCSKEEMAAVDKGWFVFSVL